MCSLIALALEFLFLRKYLFFRLDGKIVSFLQYFDNIVLTQIKIHNMDYSLAFPLDRSITKLVLWLGKQNERK